MTPRKFLYAFLRGCNLRMTMPQRKLFEVIACFHPSIARSFRRSITICLPAINEDYLGASNVKYVNFVLHSGLHTARTFEVAY